MHPYVLIPLLAMLAASALAGAILASGPRVQGSRALAAIQVCTAGWALCEMMAGLSSDPRTAVAWLRGTTFFGLAYGPLGLAIVAEVRPQLRDALSRQARWLGVGVLALAALGLLTPLALVGAGQRAALGGWMLELGPLAPLFALVSGAMPVYAIVRFVTSREDTGPIRLHRQGLVSSSLIVLLPVSIAMLTQGVAPMLAIDLPRLATLCMVALGAQFWLLSFRDGEGPISDSGFARAILNGLPDGVVLVDQEGQIRAANETFARLVDIAAADLIGRGLGDFAGEGFDVLLAALGERELQLARAAGDPIPVAISSVPIEDRQGGSIGLVVLVRDLRAVVGLRRHLVVSGRLAAVGELAAGIAHEVNNPIAYIQANLNQLRRHRRAIEEHVAEADVHFESPLGLLVTGDGAIDHAQGRITQVADIVQEVRSFAHSGGEAGAPCDLNELLDGVLRLARLQRDEGLRIEREQQDLPAVVCSAQGMKQVFLGLIRRASAASGDSGRVRVCTLVEDGRAVVTIEDEGAPIPCELSGDLFVDPFDPALGEWGGLELGISHQLVAEEGGELLVRVGSLGGTCVRVALPLSEPSMSAAYLAGSAVT